MTESASYVLSLSCPDGPGIVHAVSGAIASVGGNITESQQFGAADTGNFFMRVELEAQASEESLRAALSPVAEQFAMTWNLDRSGRPMRTIVMVSKAEHCLNDLLYRERAGLLPVEIVAVVGNHDTLRPLAEFYGKSFVHVPVTAETKPDAEAALLAMVEEMGVE